MFFAEDIVKLIFEYGSFDAASTSATSSLLTIFAVGMFAHSGNVYVTRFFYAKEKAMLPVVSGIIAVFVVNIGIVLLFIDQAGASAVAWGTTIAAYFQLLLLMAVSRKVLDLELKNYAGIFKILLSAFILALAALLTKWLLQAVPYVFVRAACAGFVLLFVYIGLAIVLKMDEAKRLPVIKRLFSS
jgi:putative peptidoglycan lipid II flippase